MYRKLVRGKIHGATVTGANMQYEGSVAIDANLLNVAGIAPFESVHVWNVANAERFETYAIASLAGSGEVMVNGAAARRVMAGDKVIITSFVWLTEEELSHHEPSVVIVDDANQMTI
jgi:aspartate 1-decarboxylase